MSRYFFALDICSNDKMNIEQWRHILLKEHIAGTKEQALFIAQLKTIPAENFHITLAFLGTLTSQQKHQLIERAEQIATSVTPQLNELTLSLATLGLFKKPKVLYLSTSQPQWLTSLAHQLSQAALTLGIFQEQRAYLTHVSLFRKAKALIFSDAKCQENIHIQSFSLYHSVSHEEGVQYLPVKTWQLSYLP